MAQNPPSTSYKRPWSYSLRVGWRKVYRLIVQPRVVRQDRIVVVDESERCTNPLFLIGCHRSGTTLLRQIVDSHSHIACPPESYFIEFLARAFGEDPFRQGLSYMGYDEAGMAASMARYVGGHFEAYRKSKDKPRWADKTPHYTACLPFIDRLFAPGVQYVMIYRHPFDVLNSLMSKGWRMSDDTEGEDDPFRQTARYVARSQTNMLDFQAEHGDRCFELRYEQLMGQPEPVLREMFEFLGEPWEQQVMAFNDQKHDIGVGDAEAMVIKGFRPSLNNWHHWTDAQVAQARELMGEVCDRLGYSTQREPAAASAS